VVDGHVFPDDPARLYLEGKAANVALIAGTNADEGTLGGGPPVKNAEALRKFAEKQYGQQSQAMLAVYPATGDAEAFATAVAATGDWEFLQGTRAVLRAVAKANQRVYQYQFTRLNGVGRRIKWGVFHASELPYVFGTLPDSAYGTTATFLGDFSVDPDTYSEQDARLSKAMNAAWVRFAKTGDPNGPGLPSWPRFSNGKEGYMEFGDQIVSKEGLRKKQIDFLTDFSAQQREHAAGSH
jgi:para-nitrobenzyl esterase